MSVEKDDDVTPREVKSLRKLANANFTKFAVQVQHVSAEVQMKIIEQLPEFKKLATEAIEKISEAHESSLNSIQHSEDHVHEGIREWRGALIAILHDPSLSLEEKLRITTEIGQTVKVQAAIHAENNRLKVAMFGKVVIGVVAVAGAIVVAVTGGKFGIDQGDNNA